MKGLAARSKDGEAVKRMSTLSPMLRINSTSPRGVRLLTAAATLVPTCLCRERNAYPPSPKKECSGSCVEYSYPDFISILLAYETRQGDDIEERWSCLRQIFSIYCKVVSTIPQLSLWFLRILHAEGVFDVVKAQLEYILCCSDQESFECPILDESLPLEVGWAKVVTEVDTSVKAIQRAAVGCAGMAEGDQDRAISAIIGAFTALVGCSTCGELISLSSHLHAAGFWELCEVPGALYVHGHVYTDAGGLLVLLFNRPRKTMPGFQVDVQMCIDIIEVLEACAQNVHYVHPDILSRLLYTISKAAIEKHLFNLMDIEPGDSSDVVLVSRLMTSSLQNLITEPTSDRIKQLACAHRSFDAVVCLLDEHPTCLEFSIPFLEMFRRHMHVKGWLGRYPGLTPAQVLVDLLKSTRPTARTTRFLRELTVSIKMVERSNGDFVDSESVKPSMYLAMVEYVTINMASRLVYTEKEFARILGLIGLLLKAVDYNTARSVQTPVISISVSGQTPVAAAGAMQVPGWGQASPSSLALAPSSEVQVAVDTVNIQLMEMWSYVLQRLYVYLPLQDGDRWHDNWWNEELYFGSIYKLWVCVLFETDANVMDMSIRVFMALARSSRMGMTRGRALLVAEKYVQRYLATGDLTIASHAQRIVSAIVAIPISGPRRALYNQDLWNHVISIPSEDFSEERTAWLVGAYRGQLHVISQLASKLERSSFQFGSKRLSH